VGEWAGLADRFRRGLELGPQRTALRAGGRSHSYASLHEAALSLGAAALGVGPPPARMGVLAGGIVPACIGVLAALYASAAAVPLNPDFPPARTRAMIAAAGLTVVIADDRGRAVLDRSGGPPPGLRIVSADARGPWPLAAPRQAAGPDTAYIMFTSGSTGRPKGVPISHDNVRSFLDAAQARYRIDSSDVLAQTFEPTFDLFMFGLFMAWSANATLVAAPAAVLGRLAGFAAKEGLTVWFSVPGTIRLLRRLGRLDPGSLPALRLSMFCGEPLTCADAEAWGMAAPNGTVENLYGPTELTIACTAHRWRPSEAGVSGLVPIGMPFPGARCLLAVSDRGPDGDEGELCVTGPQMFAGYLDPADDVGRFLEHGGSRWYRTGDRVRRLSGGELAYLGRLDQQVKVRGYRVEPLEVEHALRQCAGVGDCVVVAVPHGGETELAAVYTGDPAAADGLARTLADSLPGYMVPAVVRHVAELPVNSNGKIDRQVLAGWARHAVASGGPTEGSD
jgi:amino acid adenylation domain-containing protein